MAYPYNSGEVRHEEMVQAVMLSRAQLCEDCGMITEANNGHCRVCSSHSVINLAKVLNRDNSELLQAIKTVIAWEADYRAINHLGKNPPECFQWLAKVLNREGK